jgi:hypothetical protein
MFQTINKWINTGYETLIKKDADEILRPFLDKDVGCASTSFLFPHLLDFKEVQVSDRVIEILRTPKTFSPFRTHGKIRFCLEATDKKNWTKVKCEILPGNNTMPYVIAYQLLTTSALSFWLFGKELSIKVGGGLLVLIVPAIISYFRYRMDRTELIDYSRAVIKLMRD